MTISRFVSMAALLAIVMAGARSAGARGAQPSGDFVTLCEDGGGVGWWRPAKDLLETIHGQIAEYGEIRMPAVSADGQSRATAATVRPPVRVSNVRLVERLERVPRLCATFTEDRRQSAPRPVSTRWLARERITYCQMSDGQSWEGGLAKILEAMANDGLSRTLQQDEAVLIFDPNTRTFAQGMARRGETVRVGGKYVTDVELLPNEGAPPSVCVSFAN